jgi:transposase-like protein
MSTQPKRHDSAQPRIDAKVVLRAAVAGAGPSVAIPGAAVPQNAPSCPDLPRESAKMQNEPIASTARTHAGAERSAAPDRSLNQPASRPENEPKTHPRMPQFAPKCPGKTSSLQNEAIARGEGHSPRDLTPRQLTAISALFAGHSFSDIARRMNIDRKTLFRWRNNDAFVAEIERRYAEQQGRRVAPRDPPHAPSSGAFWLNELRRRCKGLIK